MVTPQWSPVSARARVAGVVLIVIVGLLNFHVPHFLFQEPSAGGNAGHLLESALSVHLLAAVVAAVAIARNRRWGWVLGIVLALIAVVLWLLQEAVGLPSLPRSWTEPSRLFTLVIESVYVAVAWYQLTHPPRVRAT